MRARITSSAAILLFLCLSCGGTPARRERRVPAGEALYFLTIQHENRMSEAFQLVGITAQLNDRLIFEQSVDVEGEQDRVIDSPKCLLSQRVPAGDHEVVIELRYRGRGYGVFSYLNEYRFRVGSTHMVEVPTNAYGVHVTSIGQENGGATTPLEDRPRVRWEVAVERSDPNPACP